VSAISGSVDSTLADECNTIGSAHSWSIADATLHAATAAERCALRLAMTHGCKQPSVGARNSTAVQVHWIVYRAAAARCLCELTAPSPSRDHGRATTNQRQAKDQASSS